MTRARRFMQELLDEQILYGGCVATRREVYRDCRDRGHDDRCAQYFAFSPRTLQPDDPRPALTLKMIRDHEAAR